MPGRRREARRGDERVGRTRAARVSGRGARGGEASAWPWVRAGLRAAARLLAVTSCRAEARGELAGTDFTYLGILPAVHFCWW